MKIIATILIALIFTLVGLLKFEGYFDIGIVNLVGYDDTFDANFDFLDTSSKYILFFPDLIYNAEKETLQNTFGKIINLDDKQTYLFIVNLFFLIITGIVVYIIKYFPKRNDKIYLVLGIITSYLLIADFMM